MFYPFGQMPLLIIPDHSYSELTQTEYFQKKSSSGVHEPLCPCNPFSTLQSQAESLKEQTLLCICTRINAEGMKLLKEINEEVDLSEITLFSTNDHATHDPESTEPQTSPTFDYASQEEIVLSEISTEAKQTDTPGTPNSEEGKWISRCPKRNARLRTPRNKPVPGNEVRVVTMILSREALPITAHYPYSGNFRSWPNSPHAHVDVRWAPQKKTNQIHVQPSRNHY